jgi:hypothetical protein
MSLDDWWPCTSCRALNRPKVARCVSCGVPRAPAALPLAALPASDPGAEERLKLVGPGKRAPEWSPGPEGGLDGETPQATSGPQTARAPDADRPALPARRRGLRQRLILVLGVLVLVAAVAGVGVRLASPLDGAPGAATGARGTLEVLSTRRPSSGTGQRADATAQSLAVYEVTGPTRDAVVTCTFYGRHGSRGSPGWIVRQRVEDLAPGERTTGMCRVFSFPRFGDDAPSPAQVTLGTVAELEPAPDGWDVHEID